MRETNTKIPALFSGDFYNEPRCLPKALALSQVQALVES